jgi:hypothetical protein
LLEEFVLPHKLVSSDVQERYVEQHLECDGTLRASAWSEDETSMNPSTSLSRMTRAVKEACDAAPQLLLMTQQLVVATGVSLAGIIDDECFEEESNLTTNKKGLGFLRLMRVRLAKQFSGDTNRIRRAYRELMLVYRFSTPQSLNHALF